MNFNNSTKLKTTVSSAIAIKELSENMTVKPKIAKARMSLTMFRIRKVLCRSKILKTVLIGWNIRCAKA